MTPNLVKFTGRFSDLIPSGWTFQKLFANNCRQYCKTGDGTKWGQACRIWQRHGGYLEIADLFSYSALIVKQIEDGKLKEWESYYTLGAETTGPNYWLRLDRQENKFINQKSDECVKAREWLFKESGTKEEIRAYYNRYRDFNLGDTVVALIQDLINKGWIKTVYDKRFDRKS